MGGRGDGGDRKRKGGGGDGGRKRKQFLPSGGKSHGGIKIGTRGVLVSCWSGKEPHAGREAAELFQEAYEALCPEKAAAAEPAPPADGADISAALAEEVAGLKDLSKKPFFHTPTGLSSSVYVEFRDADGPSPTEIVTWVCRRAAETKQAKTRLCNRFYPVDHTAYASLEKIGELAATLAAESFPDDAESIPFAIEYSHRAAPELDRMKVIDAIVEKIKTPPHKVNLTAPKKVILVTVLKSTCAAAVVEDFKELQKFNIRALTETPEEEEEEEGKEGEAAAAAPAQAEEGKEVAAAGEVAPAEEAAAAEEGE